MAPDIPQSLLRRFAREQRAQAVQAETLIWRAVRNRRCEGAKFLPTELVTASAEPDMARIREAMTS